MTEPVKANGTVEDLPQSKFVAHLATYPAIAAVAGLAASFPTVKMFASNAVPLLIAIKDRSKPVSEPVIKHATPVLERVDKLGDELLSTVDKHFPQLQTTHPEQVLDFAKAPVNNACTAVSAYSNAAYGAVENRVISPIKSATHSAREQYAKVYDTKGKALLRSRVDPLVLPINDRLEGIIVDYLPEGEGLPTSESVSNEISRTWRLARVAVHRARPIISEHTANVTSLPYAAKNHVISVYDAKVAKHADGKPSPTLYDAVIALIGTGSEISKETQSAIWSVIFPSDGLLNNIGIKDSKGDGLVSKASNYVYGFISPATRPENSDAAKLAPEPVGSSATSAAQNVLVEGELVAA